MANPLKIKICCISSIDEARLAIKIGADALGLVSKMPSGPGVISDELIGEIADSVTPPVDTFLLTCLSDAKSIAEQHRRCRTTTIQLVDAVSENELRRLRENLPGVKLVQVIHVQDHDAVREAVAIALWVDAILLDSGNPGAAIKELGGTGRVHNWEISAKVVASVDRPVFLAGGLNPDNVAAAVAMVRPFGVDICSGVRVGGRLNEDKLRAFVRAAQG